MTVPRILSVEDAAQVIEGLSKAVDDLAARVALLESKNPAAQAPDNTPQ